MHRRQHQEMDKCILRRKQERQKTGQHGIEVLQLQRIVGHPGEILTTTLCQAGYKCHNICSGWGEQFVDEKISNTTCFLSPCEPRRWPLIGLYLAISVY